MNIQDAINQILEGIDPDDVLTEMRGFPGRHSDSSSRGQQGIDFVHPKSKSYSDRPRLFDSSKKGVGKIGMGSNFYGRRVPDQCFGKDGMVMKLMTEPGLKKRHLLDPVNRRKR